MINYFDDNDDPSEEALAIMTENERQREIWRTLTTLCALKKARTAYLATLDGKSGYNWEGLCCSDRDHVENELELFFDWILDNPEYLTP